MYKLPTSYFVKFIQPLDYNRSLTAVAATAVPQPRQLIRSRHWFWLYHWIMYAWGFQTFHFGTST